MAIIKLFGANLLTRAAAMAATVVYMMWSDTLHPPGGEAASWLESMQCTARVLVWHGRVREGA
jgi:CBS-domain-containing membrane protein